MMKLKSLFLLLFLIITLDYVVSRRSGGSSRGSSGGSRGSSSRGSYSSHSSSSGYNSHSSPSYSSPSRPSHTYSGDKSGSTSFIRGESSGSSGYNSPFGSASVPKPSAPAERPAWSNPHYNLPSPNKPSNPSAEKPAWSNPHFPGFNSQSGSNPAARYPYGHSGSTVNRNNHGFNRTSSSNTAVTTNRLQQSSPKNRTSGLPGTYNPNVSFPSSAGSSMPQPNLNKAPYPTGTSSIPQPGLNKPPYPIGTGSMPQPGHTGNIGFNTQPHSGFNTQSHSGFNTMSHPNSGYNPSYHPSYNPSMAQPSYNPHFSQPGYGQPHQPSMGGGYYPQPIYQPAQPAAGPVIVMAGQSGGGGGRGIGQMIAEAAVFSTINAGVNRLINPYPSYHHHDSGYSSGTAGASTSTTHVTYNNYYNGQPVDPNQPSQTMSRIGTNPSAFPGGFNNVNTMSSAFPSGAPGDNGTGSSSGIVAGSTVTGTQGSIYTPTGNSASNIPAPGIVTQVKPSENMTEPLINPLNDSSLVIYGISNAELWKLTEDLFEKQEYDVKDFIELNLQNKTNSTDDVAPEPLFKISKEAYELPTIRAVRELFNVFEFDSRVKENRTLERRQKENILLDMMMNTDVMNTALTWLTSKLFIDPDDFERKDTLSHIWFNLFDGSSSGFERVFVAETLHTGDAAVVLGIQDWVNFAHLESENKVDYTGYVDKMELGDKASLVKLNYKINDLVVSNTTILVGTLPELEMALYTICFYARPGIECPISLGGTKFNVYTHLMPYFGKYLIAAAYPSI